MKINKFLIIFVVMAIFLSTGCSKGIKNYGDKIVVEKQVSGMNQYEFYSEVKDSKEVQKAKDILNSVNFENGKVSMSHPPDYKFHFEDSKSKTKGYDYGLWISPNKDKIELVVDNEAKYAQSDKEESTSLFKIITGKSLSE